MTLSRAGTAEFRGPESGSQARFRGAKGIAGREGYEPAQLQAPSRAALSARQQRRKVLGDGRPERVEVYVEVVMSQAVSHTRGRGPGHSGKRQCTKVPEGDLNAQKWEISLSRGDSIYHDTLWRARSVKAPRISFAVIRLA